MIQISDITILQETEGIKNGVDIFLVIDIGRLLLLVSKYCRQRTAIGLFAHVVDAHLTPLVLQRI
jgi:hypothetical protein